MQRKKKISRPVATTLSAKRSSLLRLRAVREQHGWTQEYLADLLGTNAFTISRWERGIAHPGPYYRRRLCQVFSSTLLDLGLAPSARSGSASKPAPAAQETLAELAELAVQELAPTHVPPVLPVFASVPLPPGALVGRDALLEKLKHQLVSGSHSSSSRRPVFFALQGLPGVGKTALALALAYDPQIREAFPDGILWAGLGPTPNAAAVLAEWATALDGTHSSEMPALLHLTSMSDIHYDHYGQQAESPTATALEAFARAVRLRIGLRRCLLILDDVWSEDAAVALQVGGSNCVHLLTTRFPVLAERFAPGQVQVVHELSGNDGVALLRHLAPLALEHENEQARELVVAVGGLPLALTLMGAYLRTEAISQQPRRIHAALTRLHDADVRLHLTAVPGPVERPPYLPAGTSVSLEAALAVSDAALPMQARSALRAMALLPAKPHTFAEAAAAAACGLAMDAVGELLDVLHDGGLLESSGTGRYTMHQLIGEYVLRHPLTSDTLPIIQAKERLAHWAQTYLEGLGESAIAAISLEHELPTLLLALDAATSLDLTSILVACLDVLVPFFAVHGLYEIAERYLDAASQGMLADTVLSAASAQQTATLARLHGHRGLLAEAHGQLVAALSAYQAALELAQVAGEPELLADILGHLGETLLYSGRHQEATLTLRRALKMTNRIARQAVVQRRRARLFRLLGVAADCTGHFEASIALYQTSLQLATMIHDLAAIADVLQNLGGNQARQGHVQQAEASLQEGLRAARTLNYAPRISALLNNLALTVHWQGRTDEAQGYIQEAITLARTINHPSRLIYALQTRAQLTTAQGEILEAEVDLRESLSLARALGDPYMLCGSLNTLADMCFLNGDLPTARMLMEESLQRALDLRDHELIAYAQYGMARLAACKGERQLAWQLGKQALGYFIAEKHRHAAEVERWLATLEEPNDLGEACLITADQLYTDTL